MDINDLAFQNSQPRPNKVLSSAQMKHDLLGTKNNPSVCQSERDLNGRLTNYDTLKAPYHSNVANQESKLAKLIIIIGSNSHNTSKGETDSDISISPVRNAVINKEKINKK